MTRFQHILLADEIADKNGYYREFIHAYQAYRVFMNVENAIWSAFMGVCPHLYQTYLNQRNILDHK